MQQRDWSRREFVRAGGAVATAGAFAGAEIAAAAEADPKAAAFREFMNLEAPSNKVLMGLIGCGSRGTNVMGDFMNRPEVEVIAVCDPDSGRAAEFASRVEKKYGRRPLETHDYRKLLECRDLDAVMVGTPDHWHCLPTVHALESGLDVYVEKPVGHSIAEGRAMVNSARANKRVVQVGTQQRSAPHFREAVEVVWSGVLGQITEVRTWNFENEMPNGLGPGNDAVPPGVDYDMWLGPAPLRPFNSNRFHYQWRWFFDYAGGMLCDWGIHLMDIAQWGMKADAPETIQATGGLYALPDNRTTPDTLEAVYKFGPTPVAPKGFVMTYSNRKACARGTHDKGYGIEFFGSEAALFVDRGGWSLIPHVRDDKPVIEARSGRGGTHNHPHIKNFLECVKSRELPVSDIEIGHRSTTTPQLANIAYLTGETLRWDGAAERITNSRGANLMLGRRYRQPWDREARHFRLERDLIRLLCG